MSVITKSRHIIRCLPSGPLSQNQFRRHMVGFRVHGHILCINDVSVSDEQVQSGKYRSMAELTFRYMDDCLNEALGRLNTLSCKKYKTSFTLGN